MKFGFQAYWSISTKTQAEIETMHRHFCTYNMLSTEDSNARPEITSNIPTTKTLSTEDSNVKPVITRNIHQEKQLTEIICWCLCHNIWWWWCNKDLYSNVFHLITEKNPFTCCCYFTHTIAGKGILHQQIVWYSEIMDRPNNHFLIINHSIMKSGRLVILDMLSW